MNSIIKVIPVLCILVLLFTLLCIPATAADNEARQNQFSFYGTIGGYCVLYSIGMEFETLGRRLGLNINFSYFDLRDKIDDSLEDYEDEIVIKPFDFAVLFVPVFASYYVGGTNHRFYIDAGFVYDHYMDDFETKNYIYGIVGLGYNFSPVDGEVFFKIGPVLLYGRRDVWPWLGISLGVAL